jgi:hypothetical protein
MKEPLKVRAPEIILKYKTKTDVCLLVNYTLG